MKACEDRRSPSRRPQGFGADELNFTDSYSGHIIWRRGRGLTCRRCWLGRIRGLFDADQEFADSGRWVQADKSPVPGSAGVDGDRGSLEVFLCARARTSIPSARSLSPATTRSWCASVRTMSANTCASPASPFAPDTVRRSRYRAAYTIELSRDELLTITRAVRRRLDFERPVEIASSKTAFALRCTHRRGPTVRAGTGW
jgi:hypothetical protein